MASYDVLFLEFIQVRTEENIFQKYVSRMGFQYLFFLGRELHIDLLLHRIDLRWPYPISSSNFARDVLVFESYNAVWQDLAALLHHVDEALYTCRVDLPRVKHVRDV